MLHKDDLVSSLQNCVKRWSRQPYTKKAEKIAAVLLIIHHTQKTPLILLTKRKSTLKYHKGEISFPGGSFSKDDNSFCTTAIRETREEIGVDIKEKDIIGCLKSVRTLTSNFCIYPFVTIQEKFLRPQAFVNEVECIIDAPLFDLLCTLRVDLEHRHMSTKPLYNFSYHNQIIWGATARILKQLWDCLYLQLSDERHS
jgi:8-oxo-dGTP pyrophosphatase MutT (NUDIX family)